MPGGRSEDRTDHNHCCARQVHPGLQARLPVAVLVGYVVVLVAVVVFVLVVVAVVTMVVVVVMGCLQCLLLM